MSFNEEDFTLGWSHASNGYGLPKSASVDFLAGYAAGTEEFLKEAGVKEADRAPGWDTVAPAFAPPVPGLNNTMSDFTNTERKDLSQETADMRSDLAGRLDRQTEEGQSRDNGNMTNLDGWKQKNSSVYDLSNVRTAELVNELARRVSPQD